MANIPIVHSTTKSDYSGSGAVAGNQELVASDWNATHFTLSAGAGLQIASDGGNPPTLTFSIGGAAGSTSFGDSLLPSVDNMFDIGSPTLRWKNEYVAGAISVGTLDIVNANTLRTVFTTQANGTLLILPDGLQIVLNGDFVPQFDSPSSGNIGSVTAKWLNAYFGGTVSAGGGFQTNAATSLLAGGNIVPTSDNGSPTLGTSSFRWGGIFVSDIQAGSSDILLTPNAAVRPTIANTNLKDLGSPTALWRSIYFGTILSGGAFQTNASPGYLGTATPAFKAQAGGNSAKYIQIYHDGTTGIIQNVGTNPMTIATPAGGSITLQATGGGSIRPGNDNDTDLGTTTLRWRNAFHSGSTSSGTFVTNSTFQFGSNVQGAILTYDLTKGISGSFIIENTSLVELVRIDNSSGKFSSAFTVSAATGFQTNSSTILASGLVKLKFTSGGFAVTPDNDQSEIFQITDKNGLVFFDASSNGSRRFEFPNLGSFTIYSDNFTTTKFTVNGATGSTISVSTISAGGGFQTNAATSLLANVVQITAGAGQVGITPAGGFNTVFTAGHIQPQSDSVADVGLVGTKWRNLYVATAVSIGTSYIWRDAGAGQFKFVTDASNFNMGVNSGLTNSVVYEAFAGTDALRPNQDNVSSLGKSSNRWLNGYFGGTVSVGGNLVFTTAGAILRDTGAQIKIDSSQLVPFADNTTQFGAATSRWTSSWFVGTTSTGTLQIGAGVVTAFNNRATAVNGVLAIVAEGDQTGTSAANASLASFTVGATNGVFKVGGDVDITVISGATVTLQVAYTDWSGNSRTLVIVSSTSLGDSPANDKTIMAQNGTAITVSTTLAGGTATWNVAAWIGWVK